MANDLQEEFPIHASIWFNDISSFRDAINDATSEELEKLDPRGRTPLLLALSLGRPDMARLLIERGVSLTSTDKHGFNALHHSIITHDSDLVRKILEKREQQRTTKRLEHIPNILARLRDTPDFYCEMKWNFTSRLPLVSRVCPSDVYKIYKSGSNVRVDTTLIGFDGSWNWLRGHRSFVFKADEKNSQFTIINHENGKYLTKNVTLSSAPDTIEGIGDSVGVSAQSKDIPPLINIDDLVAYRMSTPIKVSYVDTDQIRFDRARSSSILGFRSDKTEVINGYECKVYTANNIEKVSRVRMDHLNENERAEAIREENESFESRLAPFQYLLAGRETQRVQPPQSGARVKDEYNPCDISFEEYFNTKVDLGQRDIGKYKHMTSHKQSFKANLCVCEDFPLSLREQIQPIIDLMAINSPHFAKLRDFISLQLPQGFPVKIEIPLFHLVTAVVTFGNIFALEQSVCGVTSIKDETTTACVVDDVTFDPPPGYSRSGSEESIEAHFFGTDDQFDGPTQEEIWASIKKDNIKLPDIGESNSSNSISKSTNNSELRNNQQSTSGIQSEISSNECPGHSKVITNGFVPCGTVMDTRPTESVLDHVPSAAIESQLSQSSVPDINLNPNAIVRFSAEEIQRALEISLQELKQSQAKDEQRFEEELRKACALSLEDSPGPSKNS
ncbi:Ankyrin repeat domain-containing protein 13B [Fragariocoptes setiger]|uniref:Ankyrin repeat domain-containing protein 13B n=1 Tax=Fragariocoptes setiger TaxID=1670756 RepID=A0ABQ7S8C3_9ACAR|nr:Ankyrin repeat domain-containing protein 13B [Fragariocoptes setiger]